ncbi:uncharacterized protein LOC141599448 [Silene latifolia]|uniref:uncharacterized protein LOC141599448 n=1 Tax=Silene latifolia TaxID=37657 RepID=UPI003D77842E
MQKMKAIRGNSSNLITFSNLIFRFSKFSESHHFNGYGSLNLLRIRLFSSLGPHNKNEEGIKNGGNDHDDSKFAGVNGGNFVNQSFNSGDGQKSQFAGQNAAVDHRIRGTRNDVFIKPISGENGEGSGDFGLDTKKKKKNYYPPSVRELLNCPLTDEKSRGNEDDGVKEETRFSEVNSTSPPEEIKMDVPQDADEIFNNMKKSGLIPNAVAMLEGLCNDGLVHEAMKIFGIMREKGTMPEVVVYTSVVEGFCQAEKIDDATRVFKKMKDNGIVPNAFSYAVLIKGLCKATRLEEASDLCVEMLEAGHSPNVPLFTRLVEEFCKEKGVEDAQKFILTLRQKGFLLDEKAVRVYYDKTGPTSSMVWEAIFGPKKIFGPKETT